MKNPQTFNGSKEETVKNTIFIYFLTTEHFLFLLPPSCFIFSFPLHLVLVRQFDDDRLSISFAFPSVLPFLITYSEVTMAVACFQVLLGFYVMARAQMVSNS